MKGKRITNLNELARLALDRKAVVWAERTDRDRFPASFMMNLQGWTLCKAFESGLYEYEKTPKEGDQHDNKT